MRQQPLRGRPTRAESAAIDRRIHDEAVAAFVAHGFDGTTMESVATAAGITKRTLYAKFPDKESLFSAVIPRALADMPFDEREPDLPDDDLETALRVLAGRIVDRLIAPDAVSLRRLGMIEADRIAGLDPVDGADLWATSLRSVVELLARYADAGEITIADLEVAADLFLAMTAGGPTMWADFGVFRTPDEGARHIENAVQLFLHGVLSRAHRGPV